MTGLALESSTTSAKAMLYDTETGRVTVRTAPFVFETADTAAQDADLSFAQTAALGKALCGGQSVDVVSLSGTFHSVMLLDQDMRPATPVYQWPYNGASALCGELRRDEAFTDWFYRRTGCMVSAIYPAFKLMLLARQGADLARRLAMGQGDYNFFRLTGVTATTAAMASGSGLLDIRARDYDDGVLRHIGMGRASLPPLAPFSDTQPLSPGGAAALGLEAGIPVVPPGPDGGLNQLGAGASEPGIMTFSAGTSGALRLSTGSPALADDRSLWCYLSPVSWMAGAATSGCCNCVDWARQRFFGGAVSHADIERGLRGGPENTPVFLPFLFGERCPGWDDAREAAFLGVTARHDAYDLYHSVLEGALFNLFQCYQKLCAAAGTPRHIRLSGGILHSAYWTQMAADIFDAPMECASLPHASLAGAAMLGMEALGASSALFDHRAETTVRPNPDMARRYAEKFGRYLKAYGGASITIEEETI
jgi:gluconokinase